MRDGRADDHSHQLAAGYHPRVGRQLPSQLTLSRLQIDRVGKKISQERVWNATQQVVIKEVKWVVKRNI